jgi:hypothetical protein
MTTSGKTFDIEDLSLLIKRRGEEQPKPVGRSPSDLSLPIIVEPIFDDVQDPGLVIIDTMTDVERAAYRFAQGSYIRYRIGVLGIGQAVEEVHQRLHEPLDGSTDELVKEYNLWSRYQVALFGGAPRGEVQIQDADLLADRLAFFKPNYLVLVNAGQTKNKFADKTARQLALLTHHVNAGAMSGGQRPYTLVIVTDEPIAAAIFAQYTRTCQAMNTFPAVEQFTLDEGRLLVAHARAQLAEYAARHMQVRRREAP